VSSVIPFGHELPSVGSVGFSANASGANDNAFEIAAVILLAGIFSKIAISGFPPEKSIAFVAFSGEEERLIGFEYFAKHKPIVLDSNTI
jgi:Zn-dependent M28 family amino/carboxypeptidase